MTLRAERLNRGLSVAAFARAVGVPEHVVRHAEKGGTPLPANALRIATYLGVMVTDLWPLPVVDPAREAA
jgi:transcriptional regulator with XRE-family HTH domain